MILGNATPCVPWDPVSERNKSTVLWILAIFSLSLSPVVVKLDWKELRVKKEGTKAGRMKLG